MFASVVKWLSQYSGVCSVVHTNEPEYKKCKTCNAEYCVVCMSFILAGNQIEEDLGECKNCYTKK